MNQPTEDDRCGTYAGAQAHKKRDEKPCEPCLKAQREYAAELRQDREYRERENALNAARTRAMWRLARMHRETFRALFEEESAGLPMPRKKREVSA